MKMPEELMAAIRQLPCWQLNYELQDLDAVELIIRHCANVCEQIGAEYDDPFQSLRCHNTILREFGLEP